MGRGLWHVAAVGGERLHAHARNRTQSASQSASRRCQASCPRAVTKLAWPKRRLGAAKPCLRARPCSATSRRGDGSYPGRPDATLPSWQVSGQKLGRQVWPPSRRPLGLISWGLGFLRKVFKLKKSQGQKLKEKCTCCTKCISGPEVKRFSTAKILQKVMQYLCMGKCAMVLRIFRNYLRFF